VLLVYKQILGFEVAVQHAVFVALLHSEQDLPELVFAVLSRETLVLAGFGLVLVHDFLEVPLAVLEDQDDLAPLCVDHVL